MAISQNLKKIDYTGKDYDAIITDMIQFLKANYPDKWTDFEEDNAGKMLIEALAYIADLLLFYLDRQANECYLSTAKERQKIINLCKLIGYNVATASPAQAEVLFSLQSMQETNVVIPKGTALTTAEKIRFELDDEVIITAGQLLSKGNCTEGQTHNESIGIGTGEPGQIYYLPHKGVIAVMAIYVDDSKWEKIDSLALSNSFGMNYVVDVDAFGRAKISFGDGLLGLIPADGSIIKADYRVGGGIGGNVAANTITRMPLAATTLNGETIVVTVTNPQSASGGLDAEELEHVKMWAPVSFESQGRLVTESDYEAIANSFNKENIGRFAKTSAVVHERSGEANVIRIYALSQSTSGEMVAPSQTLINAFLKEIEDIKMLTDYVEVVSADVKKVNITAEIAVLPGFLNKDVLVNGENDLKNFMQPSNRNMGEKLRYSDLYRILDSATGVDWVEISEPTKTIETSGKHELIILGEINLMVVSENVG